MNERIEKIIDQAYIELNKESPDRFFGQRTIAKKVAELIVGECLKACSRANDIKHFVPPTQEQVVLSCMREIETTFRS